MRVNDIRSIFSSDRYWKLWIRETKKANFDYFCHFLLTALFLIFVDLTVDWTIISVIFNCFYVTPFLHPTVEVLRMHFNGIGNVTVNISFLENCGSHSQIGGFRFFFFTCHPISFSATPILQVHLYGIRNMSYSKVFLPNKLQKILVKKSFILCIVDAGITDKVI